MAQNECEEVANLTNKAKRSWIRRLMSSFDLSIRGVTGTARFRVEQASDKDIEARDTFLRAFRQIIVS